MKDYELIENKSRIYFNGSIWKTDNHGKITIIGKTNRLYEDKYSIKYYNYYLCEFEDGTIVEAERSAIRNGLVKNPNNPIIYEFGYIGQGKWKSRIGGKITKEYRIWKGMIERCCDGRNLTYFDVSIDKRWYCFQNFCEDLLLLNGYENWKNDTNKINKWQLDKDIMCDKLKIHPKIYSKNTCMFVLREDNSLEMNNRTKSNYLTGHTYIATRLIDGYEEKFVNQNEFARKWELSQSKIWACISKKRKKHKGWTFKVND